MHAYCLNSRCYALLLSAVLSCHFQMLAAEEKPAVPAADRKDAQTKLLPVTTLENAFKRALQRRDALRRLIAAENRKLSDGALDAKAESDARKTIGEARKQLHTLQTAMDIVFGVGNQREYEFNEVDSTIFLRVGTVEQVFARAVNVRDKLSEYVVAKRAEMAKEKAPEKTAELAKSIAQAVKQYQAVAAALQVIYQVLPARNYEYNPHDSVLYLKVSENELETLRKQQEAAKAAAEKPKTAPK